MNKKLLNIERNGITEFNREMMHKRIVPGGSQKKDTVSVTVDFPLSYLKGRPVQDYFCLEIGDIDEGGYRKGDKLLVLKQECEENSTQDMIVSFGDSLFIGKIEREVLQLDKEQIIRFYPLGQNGARWAFFDNENSQIKILGTPKLLIREIEAEVSYA